MNNIRIILASASPRRKELLRQIGVKFDVMVSDKETDRQHRPCKSLRKTSHAKGT